MTSNAPRPAGGLPDINDPAAVEAWLDGIEREASRISARQHLVMEVATASHDIFMIKARPVPLWPTPRDRTRAYAILVVGVLLTLLGPLLVLRFGTSTATLIGLPLVGVLWIFAVAFETARAFKTRTLARGGRDEEIAAATVRLTAAKALLTHYTDDPTTMPHLDVDPDDDEAR